MPAESTRKIVCYLFSSGGKKRLIRGHAAALHQISAMGKSIMIHGPCIVARYTGRFTLACSPYALW